MILASVFFCSVLQIIILDTQVLFASSCGAGKELEIMIHALEDNEIQCHEKGSVG